VKVGRSTGVFVCACKLKQDVATTAKAKIFRITFYFQN
jgi:hypothetical protein